MISVIYNNKPIKIDKDDLIQINYFKYMVDDIDQFNNIKVDYDIDVEYFELLIKFIKNNDIVNILKYDILNNMLKLTIYFDYQYFIDKISHIEFDFKKVNDINQLYDLYLHSNQIQKLYPHLKNINVANLNVFDIPLIQYYDLTKYTNNNCIKVFSLFHHINLLSYAPCLHLYETYQSNYITKYEYTNILTKNEFVGIFKKETNCLFENFKWDNVCIAGGFLFGLINQASNSLLKTSDIDLYIYNRDEEVRKKTWRYVLEYFSQYNAEFYTFKGLIDIKIPKLKYSIQVILMDYETPNQILDSFDMNYCKLYYQGDNDVMADIGCLVAFKHQLAICETKFANSIDTRIYKTIKKGLRLLKNDDITNNTSLLQYDIINLNLYQCFEKEYDGPFQYDKLEWINYSHTMKLYTLQQGYYNNIDNRFKNKVNELDDQVLCNKFLTNEILNDLTIKQSLKMNIIHYHYIYQNQLINLLINLKYNQIFNIYEFLEKYSVRVILNQDIKSIINLYINKIIGDKNYNDKAYQNDNLFIQIYDKNLITKLNNYIKENKKVELICQMIHKYMDYGRYDGYDHFKFVLVDIKA